MKPFRALSKPPPAMTFMSTLTVEMVIDPATTEIAAASY